LRLEIEKKTQQPTLNQDKQHEHNLTLWQRKTPVPKK
jgi:hypothetical protein